MKRIIKMAALMAVVATISVEIGVVLAMDPAQATPYIIGCNFVLTWSIGLYVYLHGKNPNPN